MIFISARGVVLVHRERAEHIARALGHGAAGLVEAAVALPVSVGPTRVPASSVVHRQTTAALTLTRWRTACGWLGIAAGTAVFVGALMVPFEDPALVIALMLALRSGCNSVAELRLRRSGRRPEFAQDPCVFRHRGVQYPFVNER